MAKKSSEEKHGEGFWFGMMMGTVVGSAGLYLLGTAKGRDKLRDVLDSFENLNTDLLDELKKAVDEKDDAHAKKVVTDIHSVLGKIESTIPTKNEIKKYFVKDGKDLK